MFEKVTNVHMPHINSVITQYEFNWINHLASVNLILFICKIQIEVSPSSDCYKKKTAIHIEPLAQCPNLQDGQ